MSVPAASTIDLTNMDDRVQPLRYMELGINLNEWEKATLKSATTLKYTFKINNVNNAHEHHYPEEWNVNIEDTNDDGVKKYYILYSSAQSTAAAAKTDIEAIMTTAQTQGYTSPTQFANPSGTINGQDRINLGTPFIRWQIPSYTSSDTLDDDTYGYIYIPKVKTDASGLTTVFADQDPDFTKYVNATPSMYTVDGVGGSADLRSSANANISFYILSEVYDLGSSSWKVRGLQEKSAQAVTYPSVEALPMIQIPPLPKIKYVQLEFDLSDTATNQLADAGGVSMRMMFDSSPYLQASDTATYANQFLIHMKIMNTDNAGTAPTPFGNVMFTAQNQRIGPNSDDPKLEPANFFGVYKYNLLADDMTALPSGGAFATAVNAVKIASGALQRFTYDDASDNLQLFQLPASLQHTSAITWSNYKLFTTDANAAAPQAYTANSHTNPTPGNDLLAYVTLKLPRSADPYGAYRQPDISEIDDRAIFAMDDFVEHSIIPVHIKIPSTVSLS